ncbi:MAG TPA: hypothetical protein VMV43_11465 [Candidatus Nanopelagicaceae bacterium]|nr:hypothetical protein [Candidatus Nanopelagicaceae bacterium]
MEEEKAKKLLKIFSLTGGAYEILFGCLMIFLIVPLFNLLGAKITQLDYPIFSQTGGLLSIFIGLFLLFSSLNIEKYILNIILIIILRFTVQIVLIVNIILMPEMAIGLFLFGLMDLIFAIITIYLMRNANLSFNIMKIIK